MLLARLARPDERISCTGEMCVGHAICARDGCNVRGYPTLLAHMVELGEPLPNVKMLLLSTGWLPRGESSPSNAITQAGSIVEMTAHARQRYFNGKEPRFRRGYISATPGGRRRQLSIFIDAPTRIVCPKCSWVQLLDPTALGVTPNDDQALA